MILQVKFIKLILKWLDSNNKKQIFKLQTKSQIKVFELKSDNLNKIFKETEKIIYTRSIANSADILFDEEITHQKGSEGCAKCRIF